MRVQPVGEVGVFGKAVGRACGDGRIAGKTYSDSLCRGLAMLPYIGIIQHSLAVVAGYVKVDGAG